MNRIKLSLAISIVSISLLWWMSDPLFWQSSDTRLLQMSLLNYSGVLAIGLIALSLITASRYQKVDQYYGGLDKSYRLHKWLGISALVASVVHWSLYKLPQWTLGWTEYGPISIENNENFLIFFFQSQHGAALEVGDVVFKLFVIFVALALVKIFPYHLFYKTHRRLSIIYLLLVFHSVVLLDFSYWDEIIAPVIVLLMALAIPTAFISFFRRIGNNRKVSGLIEELNVLEESNSLRVVVAFEQEWPGHKEGQFAFVTFDKKEGAHPFTIASPWKNNGKIFFLIKELGDYTKKLKDTLRKGDSVVVEGPYGQFDFQGDKQRQIWIAAGIGIAPFMARLKSLASAEAENGHSVDLFYTFNEPDETLIEKLTGSAEKSGVNLHLIHPKTDGRLDFEGVRKQVPNWADADYWFCGPTSFGNSLKSDAVNNGVSAENFHQELFDMR
ncbi:MAG: ferredoxin reductase family protein [Candidatus Thiodiazotropha sp.]